jgi:hypothetical protein
MAQVSAVIMLFLVLHCVSFGCDLEALLCVLHTGLPVLEADGTGGCCYNIISGVTLLSC